MRMYIFFAAITFLLVSCNKQNIDASQNQLINCVPVATDPVNLTATETDTKTNAVQFVYPSITLQKSMSGLLIGFTADVAKKFQFHAYIFSAGRYYHLPSSTTGDNKYSFSIQSNTAYSTVNILRTAGVTEDFTAIKVVAVSLDYLKEQQYTINYNDFATVQAAFNLP